MKREITPCLALSKRRATMSPRCFQRRALVNSVPDARCATRNCVPQASASRRTPTTARAPSATNSTVARFAIGAAERRGSSKLSFHLFDLFRLCRLRRPRGLLLQPGRRPPDPPLRRPLQSVQRGRRRRASDGQEGRRGEASLRGAAVSGGEGAPRLGRRARRRRHLVRGLCGVCRRRFRPIGGGRQGREGDRRSSGAPRRRARPAGPSESEGLGVRRGRGQQVLSVRQVGRGEVDEGGRGGGAVSGGVKEARGEAFFCLILFL